MWKPLELWSDVRMITPKWKGEFDCWDLVLAGIALAIVAGMVWL